jgi:O-antigen ligase
VNAVLHALLLMLVVLAPLPLGSNREWAWTLCALIVAFIVLAWAVQALLRPRQVSLSAGWGVLVLFFAVVAWALLQTVAWAPQAWLHPLWEMAGGSHGSISLSPQDGWVATMRLLSYALVFFLSFQFARSRDRALLAFRWIAFAGLAYSVYGLVVFWGDYGTLFWFFDEGFKGDVRGTFVNRNSFATYVGLSLLCAIAVFSHDVARNRPSPIPMGRELRIERFILQAWKPLLAILLLTTALILTHSRGGFFSTLAGALVLLYLVDTRQRGHSVKPRVATAGAILVTVLAFVLTSEVLLERIDRLNVDNAARARVYEMTADAAGSNPLLGFGYGSYSDSFRLYRDDRLSAHFDKAHNTYLENIFELGWPAAAALFLCLAWLALRCFRGAWQRGRDWVYPATGAAASVLVGVHALFDFSLQMPGIAITYACILGAGCAQARSPRL